MISPLRVIHHMRADSDSPAVFDECGAGHLVTGLGVWAVCFYIMNPFVVAGLSLPIDLVHSTWRRDSFVLSELQQLP